MARKTNNLPEAPVEIDGDALLSPAREAFGAIVDAIGDAVGVKVKAGHTGTAYALLATAESITQGLASLESYVGTAVNQAAREDDRDRY